MLQIFTFVAKRIKQEKQMAYKAHYWSQGERKKTIKSQDLT
jgi:hypothetical protein